MSFNESDVRKFYKWLGHKSDEFTEVRIIPWPSGSTPVIQRWVQNEDDLVELCREWSGKRQCYIGVNPRIREGGKEKDVARVVAIPFDVDSKHPTDEAATDEEVAQAKERMINLNSWIQMHGYEAPLIVMSGNGFHVLQKVDISIDEDLPKKLEAYFHEAPTEGMDSIFDLPRIIKIPGTMSVKGPGTKTRPHRLSFILTEGSPKPSAHLAEYVEGLSAYTPIVKTYTPALAITPEATRERRTNSLKPCFKRFAEEGGRLTSIGSEDHLLRLALVAEAHAKGYSRAQILELFSRADDFNPKTTRDKVDNQLGKIAVDGLKAWSCRAIHKHGGCLGETCTRYGKQVAKYLAEPPIEIEEESQKELISKVLSLLEQNYLFATPDDVEILYLYRDGFYVPGEITIKGGVESILGDDANTNLCNEVINHFKRRSYVKRSEFNKFDRFMPVENGLLNLETFELTPHTPDRIFTFKLETKYDPDKRAPKFMKFINEIITNKEDLQVIQEYAGYTLIPSFPHHNFLILVGGGRNGKGALVRTLTGILGGDNVSQVPLEYLDGKHRFAVANLFGKLMNSCSEPATKALRTEVLKMITGQDRMDGEIKNKQEPLRFTSFAKYVIIANKLPPVYDTTLSFWDRLLLVELTQTFTDEQENKIPYIERQWLNDPDERSGVLNWMMEGLIRLQKQGGFTQTKTMKQKKLEYKRVSDSIGAFLADDEQVMYGPILWIMRGDLYEAYKNYGEELGVTIESSNKLIARVKLLPNVLDRKKAVKGKAERIWRGIALVSPMTQQKRLEQEEEEEDREEENEALEADEAPIIPSPSFPPSTSSPSSPKNINDQKVSREEKAASSASSASLPVQEVEDPRVKEIAEYIVKGSGKYTTDQVAYRFSGIPRHILAKLLARAETLGVIYQDTRDGRWFKA